MTFFTRSIRPAVASLALAALVLSAVPGGLVPSVVQAAPQEIEASLTATNPESVTFTNNGSETVDLSDYSFGDDQDYSAYSISGVTLDADESYTFCESGESCESDSLRSGSGTWNEDGDTLYITDDSGTVVASKDYTDATDDSPITVTFDVEEVDNEAPVISDISPADDGDAVEVTGQPIFSAEITDNQSDLIATNDVVFKVIPDDSNDDSFDIKPSRLGTGVYRVMSSNESISDIKSATGMEDGDTFTLEVTATDEAGNTTTEESTNITLNDPDDTDGPTIDSENPAEDGSVALDSSDEVTLSAEITDSTGVNDVKFSLLDGSSVAHTNTGVQEPGDTYSVKMGKNRFDNINVDDGDTFTYRVYAEDGLGNTTEKDIDNVTLQEAADPSIVSMNPATGETITLDSSDNALFEAEIIGFSEDDHDVQFFIDADGSDGASFTYGGGSLDKAGDIFSEERSKAWLENVITEDFEGTFTFRAQVNGDVNGDGTTDVIDEKTSTDITIEGLTTDATPPTPSVPTLDSPADGATTTPDVTLEWSQGDDDSFPNYNDSDYYYYQVQVSTASGTDFELTDNLVSGFGGTTDTQASKPGGLPEGTYYWRVRAFYDPNASGGGDDTVSSDYSETRSFTVESESADSGNDGDEDGSAPTLESVDPQDGSVELGPNESFVWTVDADDVDGDLRELEVDHSLEGELPEFSVYASSSNPYGGSEGDFSSAGVSVIYDEGEQEWTIDFGENVTDALVDNGGITFYIVLEDEEGNEFGSMDPTTSQNTFEYDITQKNTGTIAGSKVEAGVDGNAGIADWRIDLYSYEYTDSGFIETLQMSTTTDADGRYAFTDVPFGSYLVCEEMPDGWSQVYPDESGEVHPVCENGTNSYYVDINERNGNSYENWFENERDEEVEEEEVEEEEESSGGGSSTGTRIDRRAAPAPEPQVAGVATDNTNDVSSICPLVEDHMQMGATNDEMQVTKLQLFLNSFKDVYGGVENPITGDFGSTTDANVKRFQAHYSDEILEPWYERGIVPHNRPTGFVYKTTKWKINSLVCDDYDETPNFDGESLDENVALNS